MLHDDDDGDYDVPSDDIDRISTESLLGFVLSDVNDVLEVSLDLSELMYSVDVVVVVVDVVVVELISPG